MYDVIIIGAGVSGAAAARELSRYNAKVCVIEKEEDVCCGTSKANSAIVHAGYDAKEGSLMAKLNVRGNALMEQLSKDLDFPFKRIGSLVVCKDEEDMPNLKALYDRGVVNGVPGLRILSKEEVHEMEPNLEDDICAALYAPSAGIVCPFNLNIALAENANVNGVEFKFDTEVTDLKKSGDIWEVHTNQGVFETKYVVQQPTGGCDENLRFALERGKLLGNRLSAVEHSNAAALDVLGQFGQFIPDLQRQFAGWRKHHFLNFWFIKLHIFEHRNAECAGFARAGWCDCVHVRARHHQRNRLRLHGRWRREPHVFDGAQHFFGQIHLFKRGGKLVRFGQNLLLPGFTHGIRESPCSADLGRTYYRGKECLPISGQLHPLCSQ